MFWNVHKYDLGDMLYIYVYILILAPNINVFVQQQMSVSESIPNRIGFMAAVSYEMYFTSKNK